MSEDRKIRIASLETEAKKLRLEEQAEHRAQMEARVDKMVEGLTYEDLLIVEELVNLHRSRAWNREHDDNE